MRVTLFGRVDHLKAIFFLSVGTWNTWAQPALLCVCHTNTLKHVVWHWNTVETQLSINARLDQQTLIGRKFSGLETSFINIFARSTQVYIFHDTWIPGKPSICPSPFAQCSHTHSFQSVHDLNDNHHNWLNWDSQWIRSAIGPHYLTKITAVPLRGVDTHHVRVMHVPACTCTLRHICKSLIQLPVGPQLSWNKIWALNIPSKLKMFWWKILHNKLPTSS